MHLPYSLSRVEAEKLCQQTLLAQLHPCADGCCRTGKHAHVLILLLLLYVYCKFLSPHTSAVLQNSSSATPVRHPYVSPRPHPCEPHTSPHDCTILAVVSVCVYERMQDLAPQSASCGNKKNSNKPSHFLRVKGGSFANCALNTVN